MKEIILSPHEPTNIFLTDEEIENICLALLHTMRNNDNVEAVKEFKKIQVKLLEKASKKTKDTINITNMIEGSTTPPQYERN